MPFSLLFPAVTAAFKALLRKGEGREGWKSRVLMVREREGGRDEKGKGTFSERPFVSFGEQYRVHKKRCECHAFQHNNVGLFL